VSRAVLCLVELDNGEIAVASQRALAVARSLAVTLPLALAPSLAAGPSLGAPQVPTDGMPVDGVSADERPDGSPPAGALVAVAFGASGAVAESVAADLSREGVTELCLVSSHGLTGYAPVAWARALEQLAAERAATAVIAAATDHGSEVLAHLGALTGLPVAANCVAAAATGDGTWQLVRHRWAGSLLEEAVLEAPCALLTVAADAAAGDAAEPGSAPPRAAAGGIAAPELPVVTFTPSLNEADLQVRATESAEQGSGMSLATARVVIGGGRGVGGPEGFAALEELAGLLGGVVGVSRVVTSQGWRPHRQQVGQTGTKISPELYLACGISGAIQHMAGCQSAKHIVAVNTDPDAPIMSRADYAVIGDLNEVIPALVAAIREAGGLR
jgi:electron transfer flavoprotein alpha subunit